MTAIYVRTALVIFVDENYPRGHPAHAYNFGIYADLVRRIPMFQTVEELTDGVLNEMVRARHAGGVSAATVNRTLTEYLSRAYSYYERTRGVTLAKPNWKNHRLKEPRQRERFISDAEYEKLKNGADPDYMRVVDFALLTGLRLSNLLPTWDQISYDLTTMTGTIKVVIKGGDKMEFDLPGHAIVLIDTAPYPLIIRPMSISPWVFYYRNAVGDLHPITQRLRRSKVPRFAIVGVPNC